MSHVVPNSMDHPQCYTWSPTPHMVPNTNTTTCGPHHTWSPTPWIVPNTAGSPKWTPTPRGHPAGSPWPRFLYAKLLLLLTELQTLKMENTRQILHIQDLSSMTPLLSEIIS